ncbi:MAG: dephospho-CoA kinase [Candidatus Puniceispirillum sp.]
MIIIRLTGMIASGKTTVSDMFTARSIPVHNADQVVHRLLGAAGAAVAKILDVFGADVGNHETGIDRGKLGALVFADDDAREKLEAILHPMVSDDRDKFLQTHRQAGTPCVVLDIPLLFETGGDEICDYVIVTNAPADVIRQRALSRAGMTAEKLAGILQNQMPAADKIARADIVLDTDLPIANTKSQLDAWLESLGLESLGIGKSGNG